MTIELQSIYSVLVPNGRFLDMPDGFWVIAGAIILFGGAYAAWCWREDHPRGISSVRLPDELTDRVKEITGKKTRCKAVEAALREFVRARRG